MIYLKPGHRYDEKRSAWFGGDLQLPGWLCGDLLMEMTVVIESSSARLRIQTEVGIMKNGSCLVSVDYIKLCLMVDLLCVLESKMGIPNTLLMLQTVASRLCRIHHALQHFLWVFLPQPMPLRFPQNVSFAVLTTTVYLLLQSFIYPQPTASEHPSLFRHNPFPVNSQLVHHSHIQPMENNNTFSNFQDMQKQERSSMVYAQNGQETYTIPSASFTPPSHLQPTSYYPQLHNQTLEFPYVLLPEHQAQLVFPACSNGLAIDVPEVACSMQPLGISDIEEQRKDYLSTCKAARANRMRKRQKRVGRHVMSSGSSSISHNGSNGYLECFNTFVPPDNKELRLLLQKQLTSSDVGSNGRIILPKKNAERNLPNLSSREGIMVVIRDVHSNNWWRMRYGFWENHKGRIYILDQCGDFVNQNRLATGDIITLYEDERKELYFSIQKKKNPTATPSITPSNEQRYSYYTDTRTLFGEEATEEENSSLQVLMEEFKHTEQPDANNLMTL